MELWNKTRAIATWTALSWTQIALRYKHELYKLLA